jgi:hypothetical protein
VSWITSRFDHRPDDDVPITVAFRARTRNFPRRLSFFRLEVEHKARMERHHSVSQRQNKLLLFFVVVYVATKYYVYFFDTIGRSCQQVLITVKQKIHAPLLPNCKLIITTILCILYIYTSKYLYIIKNLLNKIFIGFYCY